MTCPNRVLPTGELAAIALRGTLMGNRGILHDATGTLGRARWRHPHWVCCTLAFKDRRRPIMAPGRYTELFFLDEAVALAAGHRPCAECRRADHDRFLDAWRPPTATAPRRPSSTASSTPPGSSPRPAASAATPRPGPASPAAPSSSRTARRPSSEATPSTPSRPKATAPPSPVLVAERP